MGISLIRDRCQKLDAVDPASQRTRIGSYGKIADHDLDTHLPAKS